MKKIFLLICILIAPKANAGISTEAVIVIRPGSDLSSYSTAELKKRVWDLEKAVWQLQRQVFALELSSSQKPTPSVPNQPKEKFTCFVSSMGKTFTATSESEMESKASVLKQCSEKLNAIHCDEDEVKCGK
ncbi:MAG: hypothetical protein HQK50_16750 [Oligoflexia bacterium]|nr:hypothetical protein [Oligoflexia bacterium]MBF0367228.1 hypothetical protein [Oligoflexia bacterium]